METQQQREVKFKLAQLQNKQFVAFVSQAASCLNLQLIQILAATLNICSALEL